MNCTRTASVPSSFIMRVVFLITCVQRARTTTDGESFNLSHKPKEAAQKIENKKKPRKRGKDIDGSTILTLRPALGFLGGDSALMPPGVLNPERRGKNGNMSARFSQPS